MGATLNPRFVASHHTTHTTFPRTKFRYALRVPVPCAAHTSRAPNIFFCNCRCGRRSRIICSGCCCKDLARAPCPEARGSVFSMRFPSPSADPRHPSTRALCHRPRRLPPPSVASAGKVCCSTCASREPCAEQRQPLSVSAGPISPRQRSAAPAAGGCGSGGTEWIG